MDLDTQRKVNQLNARASWARTIDIAPDELVPFKLVPSATSTRADWSKPFTVDRPSVFQLMSGGVDVSHLVAVSHKTPDDTMWSEGRVRKNALGRAYCLAVGDYWAYVPLLTGDPAFFMARLSDASSDLPSASAALDDGGGGGAGVVVVTSLNKAAFTTNQKNVTAAGTGVVLPTIAVPGGFHLVIQAKPGNAGYIYLGTTKANAENHAVADILAPGATRKLGINSSALCWIDADVSGEGVTLIVEQD